MLQEYASPYSHVCRFVISVTSNGVRSLSCEVGWVVEDFGTATLIGVELLLCSLELSRIGGLSLYCRHQRCTALPSACSPPAPAQQASALTLLEPPAPPPLQRTAFASCRPSHSGA